MKIDVRDALTNFEESWTSEYRAAIARAVARGWIRYGQPAKRAGGLSHQKTKDAPALNRRVRGGV
jgi:hypothetical protein